MRHNGDQLWTIRWSATAPTKTACFLQAVLLAGVFAIVVTLTVQGLVTAPSIPLQLILFAIALPATWLVIERVTYWPPGSGSDCGSTIPTIEFTPKRVTCLSGHRGLEAGSVLSVEAVSRYGGAWTVKLRPQSGGAPAFDITIWRTQIDKEMFRRLAVLIAWHAEKTA